MKVEVEIQDSPSSQPFTFGGVEEILAERRGRVRRTFARSSWSSRIAMPAR